MKTHAVDVDILKKLVGQMTKNTAVMMDRDLEFFLHPDVGVFIPALGQCEYAVTPSHTHPSYTFIYYFQSVSDFVVEGKHMAYDLVEGKCLSAMSPGIHHQEIKEACFQSYMAIAMDAALFDETLLQYVQQIPVFKGEAFVPHPELLCLLRCFMLEATEHRNKNTELFDHLALAIIHLVVRSVVSDSKKTVPLYDRFEVDRVIAFMNSHFWQKLTVDDLAEQANLSAGHFSKIFKSVTGETPMDYLNMLRLQKSRMMLINEGKSITEIAMSCGFSSSSYFSACFLEKFKMTPSAYRRNCLKLDCL